MWLGNLAVESQLIELGLLAHLELAVTVGPMDPWGYFNFVLNRAIAHCIINFDWVLLIQEGGDGPATLLAFPH